MIFFYRSAGVKRPLEDTNGAPEAKRAKTDAVVPSPVMQHFMQNMNYGYSALLQAFQYLKVQELLRASRVCHMWRDLALHKDLVRKCITLQLYKVSVEIGISS